MRTCVFDIVYVWTTNTGEYYMHRETKDILVTPVITLLRDFHATPPPPGGTHRKITVRNRVHEYRWEHRITWFIKILTCVCIPYFNWKLISPFPFKKSITTLQTKNAIMNLIWLCIRLFKKKMQEKLPCTVFTFQYPREKVEISTEKFGSHV